MTIASSHLYKSKNKSHISLSFYISIPIHSCNDKNVSYLNGLTAHMTLLNKVNKYYLKKTTFEHA